MSAIQIKTLIHINIFKTARSHSDRSPGWTQSDGTPHRTLWRDESNGIPHSQPTFPDSEENLRSNISDKIRF